MRNKSNRKLEIQDVIAYCKPNHEPTVFVSKLYANITRQAEGKGVNPMDEIMIREDFDKVQALVNFEATFEYWCNKVTCYRDIAKYLRQNYK